MKLFYFTFILLLTSFFVLPAQNVGIGTNTPDLSAKLDISSSNTGLLIPRVSIGDVSVFGLSGSTSTAGMLVYNTNASTTNGFGQGFYYWNNSIWNYVANGDVLNASLDNGKIWIGDASNSPVEQIISGDATMSNTGVLDLEDDAVETSEILNNAVDGSKIQLTGNANGDLMYYNGTDWLALSSGTAGQVLVTNGAAAPSWNNPTDLFIFRNGLTETNPNIVELGGPLTKNTTITQGTFQMTYNLNSTGDFNVQDNGTTRFQVLDNGRIEMSATTDANGTANSGVLEIGNTLRLDGNEIITNTGTILYINNDNNGDVRVDGTTLVVDASTNRVGLLTAAPSRTLDVNGTVRIRGGSPAQGKVLQSQDVNGNAIWGYALPKGSIVAWHKNGGGGTLPAEWRECNGGAAVNGVSIPNLNGNTTSESGDASRGRFLRGSTSSGLYQTDQANNLDWINHDDSGNGDTDDYLDDDGGVVTIRNYSTSGDRFQANVDGFETRVTNMSVVWIIKVY